MVVKYETRHEKISDVAKITAIKQILPVEVLNNFRGKMYEEYATYRQDIENYMNDKHAPSASGTRVPMDVDALIAAAVSEAVSVGSGEASNADKHDESDDDGKQMIAYASAAASKAIKSYKGKSGGKGKDDGKGGKGYRQQPYQDHRWSDSWGAGPQDWSGQWNGKGGKDTRKGNKSDGKGGGKGGKDVGKGGKKCYNCQGWGHMSRDCPSQRAINAVDEPEGVHDEDEGDEAAWCIVEDNECHECASDVFGKVVSKSEKKRAKQDEKDAGKEEDDKQEIHVIEEVQGKWVRISAGVDSCASNTVIPSKMFPTMAKKETEQSRKGKEFTAANGGKIKNEGEKMIPFRTRDNEDKRVRAQISDGTRMLISASKMTKAGCKVHLDAENPYIQNVKTKKMTKLRHKNGIFLLDMWVNTDITGPVFSRQGS